MRSTECLKNTAKDYESLWRETEPDLPWEEISTLMVQIITNFPDAIAIANDQRLASKLILAIDFRSAPPHMDFGKIVGIMNTGLIYIKARCPEIVENIDEIESPRTYLLDWPKGGSDKGNI